MKPDTLAKLQSVPAMNTTARFVKAEAELSETKSNISTTETSIVDKNRERDDLLRDSDGRWLTGIDTTSVDRKITELRQQHSSLCRRREVLIYDIGPNGSLQSQAWVEVSEVFAAELADIADRGARANQELAEIREDLATIKNWLDNRGYPAGVMLDRLR